MKFEKIMSRFCKDIGIDKKTLLSMFIGVSFNHKTDLEESSIKNGSAIKESIGRESGNISLNAI